MNWKKLICIARRQHPMKLREHKKAYEDGDTMVYRRYVCEWCGHEREEYTREDWDASV